MKASLEHDDIQAIAGAVAEILKPLILSGNGKAADDIIFDKRGLSEYLKVSLSTVNKLVSDKVIPRFKINQGQSGGVRFYKRDIDKWIGRQSIPVIDTFRGLSMAGRPADNQSVNHTRRTANIKGL